MQRLGSVAAHVLVGVGPEPCGAGVSRSGSGLAADESDEGWGLMGGYARARKAEDGMILIEWGGSGAWSGYSMRCFYGTTPDRKQILQDRWPAFVGWTDGADGGDKDNSFVIIEHPDPEAKKLYFVLQDGASKLRSPVFELE